MNSLKKSKTQNVTWSNLLWNTPQSIVIKPKTFSGFWEILCIYKNQSYIIEPFGLSDFYIFQYLHRLLKSYFVHNEDNLNFLSWPNRRAGELNYSWIIYHFEQIWKSPVRGLKTRLIWLRRLKNSGETFLSITMTVMNLNWQRSPLGSQYCYH